MLNSRWFLDQVSDREINLHSLEEVIHVCQTKFQRLEILRIGYFGKTLVLDGKLQSAEVDEYIYHEALVHLPLMSHGGPRSVLIAGGGEGATIREVLKYPSVEKVYMVDLDEEVVEACKKYMPEWHQNTFDDPRVSLFFDDARKFIRDSDEKFDVIILDLPEPFEEGPAIKLYTVEFYQEVKEHLNDSGVVVTQATSVSVVNYRAYLCIARTMKEVFPVVRPYWASIPSFYQPWGFVFGSSGPDPMALTDREIAEKISALKGQLRYYNPEIHRAMLAMPEYMKRALKETEQINTDSNPISFYQV